MKETLQALASYNIWANKKFIDILLKLDDEILDKEIISSFNSLRLTAYHMWGAESIWLQRLQLAEQPAWAPATFTGSMAEACGEWEKASKGLLQFVEKQFDDQSFTHVLQYYDLRKLSQKKKVSTVLLQLFTHAGYHRGQLVTMMRQAGISKIPGTDYLLFSKQ